MTVIIILINFSKLRTLPNAELVVIKGAGHVPIFTRTREVVDAIEGMFFNGK